jgi:hypothetical protein
MLILCFVCLMPVYALQLLFEKRIGFAYTDLMLGVSKVDELQVAIPPDEAFDLFVAELATGKFSGDVQLERGSGSIVLRTKVTGKSFGEIVKVYINKSDSASSIVTISSKPLISTTLVDYGKNAENMEIIRAAIRDAEKKYLDKRLLL